MGEQAIKQEVNQRIIKDTDIAEKAADTNVDFDFLTRIFNSSIDE